ncbi:RHS repeat-associated core domain-containing protein [Cyclobacterium plantarum]|uniref:RHS repeat-associated core domain-containing protein n=1 Tax=Cyclobacterium plantarum TaxID=2716263 RepID=UPI003F6ECB8A
MKNRFHSPSSRIPIQYIIRMLLCFALLIILLPVSVLGQNIPVPNITGPGGLQANALTGNLFFQRTDLVIPGQGLSINLTFSYNSNRDTVDWGFGKGWIMPYAMHYEIEEDTLFLVRSDGRRDKYLNTEEGEFQPPKGIFDKLERYEETKLLLTTKQGVKYFFEENDHRKLTKIEEPNGNTISLSYEGGNLTNIQDATNRNIELKWENDHLKELVDSNHDPNRIISYGYDGEHHLTSVTYPENHSRKYRYKNGRLEDIVDENENVFNVYYSGERVNRLCSSITTMTITYSPENLKTYIVEEGAAGNQTTTYEFDEQRRLINKSGNCCGYDIAYAYDEDNNITKMTDAKGNIFRYSYDNRGNRLTETDAFSNTVQFSYDDNFNWVKSITDHNSNKTEYDYDENGNLTDIRAPEGVELKFFYKSNGNLERTKDGKGNLTDFFYDDNGNIKTISYPTGEEVLDYDAVGNIKSFTDRNDNTLKFDFDAFNQLQWVEDPLENRINYDYDKNGNLTKIIDARNIEQDHKFDVHNRLEKVITTLGTTEYRYDPLGNLTQIIDANDNTNTFVYNDLNLLLSETDGEGFTTVYTYDANGNRTSRRDANGEITSYAYDELNRLTGKTYRGNQETYKYDAVGNLIKATNNTISISFKYDKLNRLVEKIINNWGKRISYSYDANSNRETMTDPDGGITHYKYDAENRLDSLINPLGQVTRFAYDNGGRLIRQENANRTHTTFAYDKADRLDSLVNIGPEGVISSYIYTHDKNGNRLTKKLKDGTEDKYDYDDANRVTDVTYSDGTIEKYTMDSTGNRSHLVRDGNTTIYSYDQADRITTAGNTRFTFDANGNMTGKIVDGDSTVFEYDGENKLIGVMLPDGIIIRYTYDPFGNRISKSDNKGNRVRYVLDFDNVLMELDQNNQTVARYTSGLEMDSWISMDRESATFLYHKDGLGSVTELTELNGNIAQIYDYDIYGILKGQSGDVQNPYTYTGREKDSETGLYYYRSRFYQPKLGRFMNKDSFDGFFINPKSQNKFSHVEGNPVNFIDPLGYNKIDCSDGGLTHTISVSMSIPDPVRRVLGKIYNKPWYLIGQGGSIGMSFSHPHSLFGEGRFDAGIGFQSIAGGLDISGASGIGRIGLTYGINGGSVRDQFGRGSVVYLHAGSYGGGLTFDDKGKASGVNMTFGPGMIVGGGQTWSGGFNLRDFRFNEFDIGSEEKCSQRGYQGENGLLNFAILNVFIPLIRARDPNDILGPPGYGPEKWVSVSDVLDYKIRFENDPDFATAAARNVFVDHSFSEFINPSSLRLSNYGFGDYVYQSPENRSYHNTKLDVADSLGVAVDFTGGLDVVSDKAFWTFVSKDPLTGLEPEDPRLGFLPVNDSIRGNGEGFVDFSVMPKADAKTGDIIEASASIIFDENAPITTPTISHTIDADLPQSRIDSVVVEEGTLQIHTSASDIDSGLESYELYVSTNGGILELLDNFQTAENTFPFSGNIDSTYQFITFATDNTGNIEGIKELVGPYSFADPVNLLMENFNPERGYVSDTVRIVGEGFKDIVSISFGGVEAARFEIIDEATLWVIVPDGAKNGTITLRNQKGQEAESEEVFEVLEVVPPVELTLTSFTPEEGYVLDTVRIVGEGFRGIVSISFGGVEAAKFEIIDEAILWVIVPDGAKNGTITIRNQEGQEAESVEIFEVLEVVVPIELNIASFDPMEGYVSDTIRIVGEGFIDIVSISFSGVEAVKFEVVNETTLWVIVPDGAKNGTIAIQNQEGQEAESVEIFEVLQVVAPVELALTSFAPDQGYVSDTVRIVGEGFIDIVSISFGGVEAAKYEVVDETTIWVIVPDGAKNGTIAIRNQDGQEAVSGEDFVIIPSTEPAMLSINDFKPKQGNAKDTVTITGEGFVNIVFISFGSIETSEFGILDENTLWAIVPINAQDGPVTIKNQLGVEAVSEDNYDVLNATDPTGIPEPIFRQLRIYPNPTTGQFTLKTTMGTLPISTVRFVSMTGAIIFEKELGGSASKEIIFDISNHPPGTYILYLEVEGKTFIYKIMKR